MANTVVIAEKRLVRRARGRAQMMQLTQRVKDMIVVSVPGGL